MSSMDELVALHCPHGVEFRGLLDLAEYVRGVTYNKGQEQDDGPTAVLRANNITLSSNSLNLADLKRVSADVRVRTNQQLRAGDVLICAGSGSRQHIGKVAYVGEDRSETFGGFMGVLRARGESGLEPRYLYHALTGRSFSSYLDGALSTTTINNLNARVLAGFRIPVPPREVQLEIARILDRFAQLGTELEAELVAELEARRLQYEHYRRELLSLDDGATWTSLGDIAAIGTGSHDTKDAVLDGDYVFYARGREPLRLNSYDFDERAIITAGDGVGVGKVFHFAEGQYALHQRAYRIVPSEGIDARYLYHHLVADFSRYLERISVHASVTSLRRPMFLKYPVRLPPLVEQRRVAAVLDKLDSLETALVGALSDEMADRRRQFGHCRDKLLTFEEAAA